MAQRIITFLPEFLLLAALPLMLLVSRFRTSATPKTYFTLSRYFVLFCLIFTVVLYNRSGYPQYYENSLYTSLFKVIIYLLSLLWFALSCKWFLMEDRSSLGFYALCLSSLAALSVMISSLNLGIMAAAWLLISLFNFCLLRLSPERYRPRLPQLSAQRAVFWPFVRSGMRIAVASLRLSGLWQCPAGAASAKRKKRRSFGRGRVNYGRFVVFSGFGTVSFLVS